MRAKPFRRLLEIGAGASVMWLAHTLALPLLRVLPGFDARIEELLRIHPQMSASIALLVSTAIAALVSIVRESPRKLGLSLPIWFGLLVGSVTFESRMAGAPRHLYDVALLFAVLRALGVVAGATLMYRLRRGWIEREGAAVPLTVR
jgi:hypothetical protein